MLMVLKQRYPGSEDLWSGPICSTPKEAGERYQGPADKSQRENWYVSFIGYLSTNADDGE